MDIQLEDTLNKRWQEDKGKFGYKMLMKFGWSEGKGLGRNLEGQTNAVKMTKRVDGLGLGANDDKAGNIGWSSTSMSFNSVLAALNDKYGQTAEEDSNEKKSKKKQKKPKNSKSSKTGEKISVGIKYKRMSKRTTSTYSSEEMRAILGASASVVQSSNPFSQISEAVGASQQGRKRRLSVVETEVDEEREVIETVESTGEKKKKKQKASQKASKKSKRLAIETGESSIRLERSVEISQEA